MHKCSGGLQMALVGLHRKVARYVWYILDWKLPHQMTAFVISRAQSALK